MATYNGSHYVVDQLRSILPQLTNSDEIVVVDDASIDDTVSQIELLEDSRIRILHSAENRGYVRAFETAIQNASGDIILLADQDDIWTRDHVAALSSALSNATVAASNLDVLGSGEPLKSPLSRRPWRLRARNSSRNLLNLLQILTGTVPYFGCTMALRREALALVLPFPDFVTESHDLWIALTGNVNRSIVHVEATTLHRRIHESNASSPKPRGVWAAINSRRMLIRALRTAWLRRSLHNQ